MFEDFTTTIKAQLYERVSSPLLSSFLISWCCWNYKFIIILLAAIPAYEKIIYIDLNIFPDAKSMFLHGVLLPFATSMLLIFVYPIPAAYIYRHVKMNQRRLKEIQQSIDDESPLSKEQARKIRREALESQLKYEAEIDSKTSENARLKEMIAELQQVQKKTLELSDIPEAVSDVDIERAANSERTSQRFTDEVDFNEAQDSPQNAPVSEADDDEYDDLPLSSTGIEVDDGLDNYMKEHIISFMKNLESFSGLEFSVVAKEGRLSVFLGGSKGSRPYVTGRYTFDTAIDVLKSMKSALSNGPPPEVKNVTIAARRMPAREDIRYAVDLVTSGLTAGDSMTDIRNKLLGHGISAGRADEAIEEVKKIIMDIQRSR